MPQGKELAGIYCLNLDIFNDTAGISCGNSIWGNIVCHHTSCSDCRAVSYTYTWQDNASAAYPDILSYAHRCSKRFPETAVFSQAFLRHSGMKYGVYMYSRAYSGIIANCDCISIQKHTVHIYFYVAAYVYVFAVVDKYRR